MGKIANHITFIVVWIAVSLLVQGTDLHAQVTTSAINGKITESKEALPGATVIAIHEPSGTQYGTVTNENGYYQLEGMRIGGPYRMEISYVGYRKGIVKDIILQLGETFSQNIELQPSTELEEVTITAPSSHFAGKKTGASLHITPQQMQQFPTFSRGLIDIIRLSPYSNGGTLGGRDQRMNNITIDGANFNNSMGLDGAVLPGGGNPISLDALETVQVSIAPYDIRQSNFIGGGINAVTKSGTNRFRGNAYTYIRNENMRGNTVDGFDLGERQEEANYTYGFNLGGPLVKDKLFFFVNAELEHAPKTIYKWKVSTAGVADSEKLISRVTDADMRLFSDKLQEMYGYNPGSWTDFSGSNKTYRALARVDWNINSKHNVMLRYNYTSNRADMPLVGPSLNINGAPVGTYSMTFRNSCWTQSNNVNSFTAELNSRFSSHINNKLLASFTFNDGNKRECNGDFPTIDIMKPDETGTNRAFMNAGYEQHAWNNGITEKVWNIANNLSIHLGTHDIVAGMSFESQNVSNCYMRYGAGYYRYASFDDFVNKAAPVAFALNYSLTGKDRALSDVHYTQFSVYGQDSWNVTPRFSLIYGLRIDLPFYMNDRYENPAITGYDFNGVRLSTADWPKATPLFSPRVGVNYDLLGDNTLKLRGGTGIFTGRFPLIFLSKMQENSGMLQTTVSTQKVGDDLLSALAGGIRTPQQVLAEIAPKFPERFPTEPGAVNTIATIDRDFKMPQVWKSSIAVDYKLPLPFDAGLTLEGTYIKDLNAIVQRNMNVIAGDDAQMKNFNGSDNRLYYPGNVESRIHDQINYAILMTNSSRGYSYNLNATLNMQPVHGLDLMLAYTYTQSKTISANKSNQIDGAWQQEPTVNGPNNLTLHTASYLITPHRVIASAGYSVSYAKNFGSSVSVFYEGGRWGNYTYMYDLDMNNDGYAYDLIYIPKTSNELNFADFKVGDRTFTASEQAEAWWAFVNQDPYLKKHKGEYAEAYAARYPWLNRFNLRFMQNFRVVTGKQENTLQLSVDIMNIGNLLNDKWGVQKDASCSNYGRLLQYKGMNEKNEPVYIMKHTTTDGVAVLPTQTFTYQKGSGNCWQIQVGVRYIFN